MLPSTAFNLRIIMNIFNICCPCLTPTPEEYEAVGDTGGVGAATVGVGAAPSEQMQTNEPSTSGSGGAAGTTPAVTTQPMRRVVLPAATKYPDPVTVPAPLVRPPAPQKYPDPIMVPAPPKPVAAATVTAPPPAAEPEPERVRLVYPFSTEGVGQAQSSQEDITDITQRLKQILASPGFGNQKSLLLKNAFRNSGYEGKSEQACNHLARVIAATKVSEVNTEDMDKYIEKLITVCGCETEDEDDHDISNHKLEHLLTAHASLDSAHADITKFSNLGTFLAETFLMQLSGCSDYHAEYALQEMQEYKIDPYTDSRLKAVLMFSLANEVHFRLTHTEKQVTSEAVKNTAINKLNDWIVKFMADCSHELAELVIKIVRDLVEGLTLPVGNIEELFQILQVRITDEYLSSLLVDEK